MRVCTYKRQTMSKPTHIISDTTPSKWRFVATIARPGTVKTYFADVNADDTWHGVKIISLVSCNHFAGLIGYSKSIEIPHCKTGQITCYKSGQINCSLHTPGLRLRIQADTGKIAT